MPDPSPRASAIFHGALARSAAERDEFVRAAAGGDQALQREVESLLRYAGQTDQFLELPAPASVNAPDDTLVGRNVGPYEVTSRIGAGGMGEVYKARDVSLGRDVAIKVLPPHLVSDPDRRARFEREARALGALNHPNIAQVFGLVDTPSGTGQAIAMEFVDGKTLEQVLEGRGAARASAEPVLEWALPIARQIAEALEAAHEAGLVHRDLKPANIKIRDDGTVKVLDFGLAKAMQDDDAGVDLQELSPTASPTRTSPAVTEAGVILGTASYMAPEQAQGKRVDRRADVWAFGVVLYEMLTGRRAFQGETVMDVIAAVLRATPPLDALPANTPEPIHRLLRRCLQRDRRERLSDMSTARLEIAEALAGGPVPARARSARLPWAIAAAAIVIAAVGVALSFTRSAPTAPEATEFDVPPPAGQMYTAAAGAGISPDGRSIAFQAGLGFGIADRWVFVRPLDSRDARPVAHRQALFSAWSPDSRSILVIADGKLKRVTVANGATTDLCDFAPTGPGQYGSAWSPAGFILFADADGLQRVAESGGAPTRFTTVDRGRGETQHAAPQLLPDGKRFFYVVQSRDATTRGLYIASIDRPEDRVRVLPEPARGIFVPAETGSRGHLLWARAGFLLAQPFNAATLALEDEPVTVQEDLAISGARPSFWLSNTGALLYRRNDQGPGSSRVVWMDRSGVKVGEATSPPATYGAIRLSADGSRLAVIRRDNQATTTRQAWVLDLDRGGWSKLGNTTGEGLFWSADGRDIVIGRGGLLFRQPSTGVGQPVPLTKTPAPTTPIDWNADGSLLLHERKNPKTLLDLFLVDAGDNTKPRLYVGTPSNETGGRFSPDGRWIAYVSDQSGRPEVYVQPVAGTGDRYSVSTEGGIEPRWRGDGQELYFIGSTNQNLVMAVPIRPAGSNLTVEAPKRVFELPFRFRQGSERQFEVAPDGRRFFTLVPDELSNAMSPLTVVLNWPSQLKK